MYISGVMSVENAKHSGCHWHAKQMKLWIEWRGTFLWKLKSHCPRSWKHVGNFICISSEHFATEGTRNQTVVMTLKSPSFPSLQSQDIFTQMWSACCFSVFLCVCVCVCLSVCLLVVPACCPFQVLNLLTHFHEIWYEHYSTGGHFPAVLTFLHSLIIMVKKVKQSCYRPEQTQRVPGS